MTDSVKRMKLRNCIRPDTYRYHVHSGSITVLWEELQKKFGSCRRFGSLDLFEIDSEVFLMRAVFVNSTITLIKKDMCSEDDVEKFHNIIGYGG